MAKTIGHYIERFKYHWWGRFGTAGFFTLVFYLVLDKLGFKMKNEYFPIRLKGLPHPFFGRFGTSDELVFNQIFIEKEYSSMKHIMNPEFIIDCGANVGYSAIWFLNQYPNARIIVIEPDSENFALCQKNLLPYGKRVSFVRAGIWPRETGLMVVKEGYKDGREWAVQVRECGSEEEPELHGVEINNLLNYSGCKNIDILKIDIEASEKYLFAENYEPWLGRVNNIAIELHGEECEEIFFKAMSSYDYDLSRLGELTLCKNIAHKVPIAAGHNIHAMM